MNWKFLKWWLVGLLALFWALWVGGSYVPAQSEPATQDIFKIGSDLVVTQDQNVGDAFAIGGDITVQEGVTVRGDVFAVGGNVQIKDNARVSGDAFAVGGKVLRADTAIVSGDEFAVLEQLSTLFDRFGVLGTLYLSNVIFWLISFVIAAIAGLLLLLLLPGHISAIATAVHTRPFTSLVYGIGGVAVLVALSVLISGSVLGAILIPLANLAALLTGLFGGTAICIWLGRRLRRQKPDAYFQHFWLGLVLLFVVSLIPFFGGLLISFVTLFGFGATLLARYGTQSASTTPLALDRFEHQPESG